MICHSTIMVFYTVTSAVPDNTDVIFAETGANDPNFNLRREPAFVLRSLTNDGVTYASVIEPHGEYNPTVEYTLNSHSHVKTVSYFENGQESYVKIETKAGDVVGLALSKNTNQAQEHSMRVEGAEMSWRGPFHLFNSNSLNGSSY